MKMDTTRAMTIIVELFELEGGMMAGESGSQLPSKARQLRVALLHWLDNVTKRMPENKKTSKTKQEDLEYGFRQCVLVTRSCIDVSGAVFLPNSASNNEQDENQSRETYQLDAFGMILWVFERFLNVLVSVDAKNSLVLDTLSAVNAIMKLIVENDVRLFADIWRRLSSFFNEIVQLYLNGSCRCVVKLAHSDLEFFTEDFDLKHCRFVSEGIEISGTLSIDRIVTILVSIFTENFKSGFASWYPSCIFQFCRSATVALECGEPTVKLKCLELLSSGLLAMHKSLHNKAIESHCLDTLIPVILSDICCAITFFSSPVVDCEADLVTAIVERCVGLTSDTLSIMLTDSPISVVCEAATTCISFLTTQRSPLFHSTIFQNFIDLICFAGERDRRLLLTGRIYDLLEYFLSNPPSLTSCDSGGNSFSVTVRFLAKIVGLLHSDAAGVGSSWMRAVEEADLAGIFPRPDSPAPVMPAKRQKTDEQAVIVAAGNIATFCKKRPLLGVIIRSLSAAMEKHSAASSNPIQCCEHIYSALLVAALFVSEVRLELEKTSAEAVTFLSAMVRAVLMPIQNMLLPFLDSISQGNGSISSNEALALLSFLSFFRHLATLQFPEKFFDNSQLLIFTGLASLPWLTAQVNWADLRLPPTFAKSFSSCASRLAVGSDYASIGLQIIDISIDAVTVLPKDVCSQWRSLIYRESLKSSSTNVVKKALQRFPFLLSVLGPTSNSLVYELLHLLVAAPDVNEDILIQVGAVVGDLACVISRQTSLSRENSSFVTLTCSCQKALTTPNPDNNPIADSSSRSASSRAVDAAMFLPIANVLSNHRNKQVRRKFAHSCLKILSHLSFSQPASIDLLKNCCFPLVIDEDDSTRLFFAEALVGVADIGEELKTAFLEKIASVEKPSQTLSYSIVLAVSSLLKNAQESVFSALLTYLVSCSLSVVMSPESKLYCAVAENFLADVIIRHNPDRPFMVFVECSSDLADLLCSRLLLVTTSAHQLAASDKDRARRRATASISYVFESISKAFRFNDFDHCLSLTIPVILPRLVITSSVDMQIRISLLEYIADLSRTTSSKLLAENIVRIWTYVLCYAQTAQAIEAANSVVRAVTKSNLDEMVSRDGQRACFQLVSKLGVNSKQAVKGLRFLAEHEQASAQKLSDGQFVDFLAQRFLGILLFLDTQFQSQSVCPAEKLSLVTSLFKLLEIMGASHVNTVRVKLLATLRIILKLKTKKFLEAALKAWALFVKYLEPDNLAHLLPQILVALLPLTKLFIGHVDTIFDNVFNSKNVAVQKCADDISYIVVDVPEFVRHLKSLPEVSAIRRSPKSFAVACSRGCANESSEVRLLALTRLKAYFTENQTALVSSIGSNALEQEWGSVLAQLLKCCHDTDINVRLAATEVFGLFGAVDPSRIPDLQSAKTHLANSQQSISLNEVTTETAFAFSLIMDVCRVFLAADDTKVQDAAAYALQQLLATFGVNESLLTSSQLSTNSCFGIRLWNRFTGSTQQLLKPYLKTKYVLTAKFDPAQVKTPFFGSSERYSQYKEWLCAFTHYLIQSLPVSTSAVNSHTSQLTNCFQACKAIVRYDAALALFLLPYIALHVVTNANSQDNNNANLTNEIGLELQAVIDACAAVNDHRLIASSGVTGNSGNCSGRDGGNTPSGQALASQAQLYVSSQLPMAAQAVFIVIDHFSRWLESANLRNAAHQQRAVVGTRRAADQQPLPPAVPLLQVEAVGNFVRKISPLSLAIAAANCRYPARAMRYFEEHLTANITSQSNSNLSSVSNAAANFLQKLFMNLGEPDGVLGVAATFCQQPTIEQIILRHEINGQLSDALTCYEQAIEQQPDNFDFYRGVIGCLLSLGRDTAALHTVAGIVGRQEEAIRLPVQVKFLPYQVEALGRLSDWSRLENCFKQSDKVLLSSSASRTIEWPVGFWSAVVALRRGNASNFGDAIAHLRRAELGPLSAASLEAASYVRGYDSIVKMHVLSELEMLSNYLLSQSKSGIQPDSSKNDNASNRVADTLALFDVRLALTEKSLAVREPLLQFRRLASKLISEAAGNQQMLAGLNSRLGRLWLASARLARKAGRYETAYGHILAAQTFADPGELRLETAKWLWARGSREDALACLERWLTVSKSSNPKDQLNARMLCLWTRYNEETAMLDSASLVKHYRAVVETNPRSEESYFYLAKYLSKLLLTASEQPVVNNAVPVANRNSIAGAPVSAGPVPALPDGPLHLEAIRSFGHSLRYGSKFIFESMPQLVSLWLDYALTVHNYSLQQQTQNSALQSARQILLGINGEMRAMLGPVPAYQFLVVFPQLISRICHPQRETAAILLEVAAYVMSAYPQQTTWLAIAVSRSMWPLRRKRAEELFARLKQLKPELNQFIADISRLTDRLCEVCDKVPDRDQDAEGNLLSLSVSRDFRQMKRLVEEQSFSRILIPLQHLLWPTLPTSRRNQQQQTQHQAFPNDEIYFAGFGDEVEVMRSLQRPKRLLVRGSNGKLYGFLCKPKEDLRKDSRWMEYVTVVNSFLRRDPEASRRRLSIRTFAVIPLNEDCGIIEWVDHTHGIRPILMQIYRERGIAKDQKFLLSCKLPVDAPLSEKLKVFKTRLLPAHPPVLGDWFKRIWFADASAWHEARLAFSRSAAVMSIAGYILGLGDRHGENILIDGKSGEVVHVDFSCLFNKADSFEYPEVVPFRLTQNMLHAMGPTGYEGVFRKACEVTMRIMRQHSDALIIVLKSFVHDPLVEWQKPANSKNKRAPTEQSGESGGEVVNSQAVKVLNDTRNRLKGCVTSSSVDLPLSIEGHVNYVIRQATDEGNLARMYIGWGAQL